MNARVVPCAAALLSVLASSVAAQQICVRGKLERAGPFSTCVSAHTHEFRCAPLRLRSNAVSLDSYVGQVVEVCGPLQAIATCRVMQVTSLRTGVDHLRLTGPVQGQVGLGQTVTIDLGVTPFRLWTVLLAGSRGWTELNPFGVLLLGSPLAALADGILDQNGNASFQITVPVNAALQGVDLWFQAGFVDISLQLIELANSECFRIV